MNHDLRLLLWEHSDQGPCMGKSREGGIASPDPPPLKNHKNIGFLSNTGPDPLKILKATKPAFQCWAIIGLPTKPHFNGVSLVGPWWPIYSHIWVLYPSTKKKKRYQIWTPSDKTFWICACSCCLQYKLHNKYIRR